MRHWQIQCNFRQRIFNCTDMQIIHFILNKILKFLTYYALFYH